ncbi:uncharacterized protein LOC141823809 [Curcuma longa]|uniref:uncharacterized protein LOC141823809 n=1 Tax=Curcuma longa TaxID=136217 RepID=UPI003D9E71E5
MLLSLLVLLKNLNAILEDGSCNQFFIPFFLITIFEGEEISFAGKLEADHDTGTFDEDVSLLKLDSLAEGVWNYYLGRYSTWIYQNGIFYERTD